MNIKPIFAFAVLVTTGSGMALAAGGHDGGHASADMAADMPMMEGGHAHSSWPEPPAAYAGKTLADWHDNTAASRGAPLYSQQCAACHGENGQGTGPVAAGLEHKPANLTKHFHEPGESGDDYLFWRISEGGQVAPFKATGSTMPGFKSTLTEQQRWDVLAYLHQSFHELEGEVGHEAAGDDDHMETGEDTHG